MLESYHRCSACGMTHPSTLWFYRETTRDGASVEWICSPRIGALRFEDRSSWRVPVEHASQRWP